MISPAPSILLLQRCGGNKLARVLRVLGSLAARDTSE